MNQNVTRAILDNMLALQPKLSSIGGQSHEEKVSKISQDIEAKIPDLFNMQEVEKRYPFDHYESMNAVLMKELLKYNRLLGLMKTSVANLQKALKGEMVMTNELKAVADSLYNN